MNVGNKNDYIIKYPHSHYLFKHAYFFGLSVYFDKCIVSILDLDMLWIFVL